MKVPDDGARGAPPDPIETGACTVGGESWTIERIDDEWADLRQGDYVYCVPLSQLPDDVDEGDRLRAPSASGSGASRWVSDERSARSA